MIVLIILRKSDFLKNAEMNLISDESMRFGKHFVALANRSFACFAIIFARDFSALSLSILGELVYVGQLGGLLRMPRTFLYDSCATVISD